MDWSVLLWILVKDWDILDSQKIFLYISYRKKLGYRQPTVDTLKRLVAPLGITLAELFNENENISILSNNERELVENYRILPNEKADILLKLSDILKE